MNVNQINIITLAYLGDAVYEVYIRNHLINTGIAKVEDLQREAIKYVSAKNQKKILDFLMNNNFLTEEEIDVVKRGRNYKRDSHPKNTDIVTYKMSTGFEALIGYLFMSNNIKRIEEIINYILGGYNEENN
jgi:ribonuclease-3 family protein